MIKIFHQYAPRELLVLVVVENLIILCSIWAAVAWRVRDFQLSLLAFPELAEKAVAMTLICQMSLHLSDAYDLSAKGWEIFLRLLKGLGITSLLIAGFYMLVPQMRLGSGLAEIAVVAIIVVVLFWRVGMEVVARVVAPGERVLLVGEGKRIRELLEQVQLRPELRMRVLGVVCESTGTQSVGAEAAVPALGTMSELEAIVRRQRPDRVVVGLKERRHKLPLRELLAVRTMGVTIEDSNALYEKVSGRLPVADLLPSELIFANGFRQSALLRAYKRAWGVCGSLVGLVLASPVMALVALAVRLDSPGPVIYRQERVGRHGKTFAMLKFRSMRVDAEQGSGPVWARVGDPRVTRVGRALRVLRLDELPQLWNVLRGDMNFVGPRPERPAFVEQLAEQIPYYTLRHSIRPGVTGWAQIRYRYGSSAEDAKTKLEYDLFYIKNVSLGLDLFVLFQTIKIMLLGRGAR
ncbi:MAG: TIGR03013 family XrtA/PEP-CTERM system glycosyltransferase [Terriglobales bacterium]